MKRSELKEIIKSAMSAETSIEETLVDADQDMAEAILNALGGEAAFEAVVRAMSTDDAQVYLGGIMRDHDIEMGREDEMDNTPITITRDIMDNLGLEEAKKDEEEEEVEDVEVDAEEDITLDEPEEEEMDMEPESDTSGLDVGEKDLQNNLEKALEAAKEMGDEKLAKQIGNTITFFTRTHVVGDAGSVEEVELNEENLDLEEGAADNLELKNLAKKLFLGFKRMGADVQLTTTKMQLNKAPKNGTDDKWGLDQKNVWIYVDDDHISINLVGEKAGGLFGKIQKDFPDFEFKDEGDSKSWNDLNVKNLQIKPGKGMSEALNEEVARFKKLAGIIK